MTTSANSTIPDSGLTQSRDASRSYQDLLDRIPYARHLGLDIPKDSAGLIVSLPFHEALIGNFMLPALHGGVLGALIEITARIAAQSEDAKARCPRILDSNINYLRSAQAKHTLASAEIIRQGRRTSLVQVTCWQDEKDRPITSGRVQLLFAKTDTNHQGDHEG
ncbi:MULTISPECIES: PaaI family thioesterase [Marinobacter]|jgi:uncharacterized protein (TIGR00369 family)|uniref:PaaI family thioesterase n=1 Tax=Marinobacter TaxID=2742 RepID=UPI003B431DE0|nr:PaaI family thioesterase [Marinobacter alkaliphilus]